MLQQKSSSSGKYSQDVERSNFEALDGVTFLYQGSQRNQHWNSIWLPWNTYCGFFACSEKTKSKSSKVNVLNFGSFCKNMSEVVNVLISTGLSGGQHIFRPPPTHPDVSFLRGDFSFDHKVNIFLHYAPPILWFLYFPENAKSWESLHFFGIFPEKHKTIKSLENLYFWHFQKNFKICKS